MSRIVTIDKIPDISYNRRSLHSSTGMLPNSPDGRSATRAVKFEQDQFQAYSALAERFSVHGHI